MIRPGGGRAGLAAALGALALLAPAAAAELVADETTLDGFAQELRERKGFDPVLVRQILGDAKLNKRVLDLTDPNRPPSKKVYWREYRRRNVTPEMIANGVRFHDLNRAALGRAEAEYGVPAAIIVAILGVETRYGQVLGGFRVLDALGTLGFNHPTRAEFFLGELEALLDIADKGEVNPLRLEGSYAGAFGISQFLPGSFERFAVDFNRDGQRDLFYAEDAIGSVANFLVEHGWDREQPIAYPASESGAASIEPSVKPEHSLEALKAGGFEVEFGDAPQFDGPWAVVDLENLSGTEYRAGTINYYALTRYNRSNKYAMAVFDLSEEIRERLESP